MERRTTCPGNAAKHLGLVDKPPSRRQAPAGMKVKELDKAEKGAKKAEKERNIKKLKALEMEEKDNLDTIVCTPQVEKHGTTAIQTHAKRRKKGKLNLSGQLLSTHLVFQRC